MRLLHSLAATLLATCAAASPVSGVSSVSGVSNNLPFYEGLSAEIQAHEAGKDDVDVAVNRKLSRSRLRKAMEDASEYQALQGQKFYLIVQGGAVNVILGTRSSTGDMDFVSTQYTPTADYTAILDQLKLSWRKSYTQAERRDKPIESGWADSSIQFFFHGRDDLWQKYRTVSLQQMAVLSNAGIDEDDGTGIYFIAAPFDWQFVGKMISVGPDGRPKKPYDWDDAGDYLVEWLRRNRKTTITYDEVKAWFPAWGQHAPSRLRRFCRKVNEAKGLQYITELEGSPSPPPR